jgi:hypothetical protein
MLFEKCPGKFFTSPPAAVLDAVNGADPPPEILCLTGLRPSPTSHVRTPLEQNLTPEVKFEKPSFLESRRK